MCLFRYKHISYIHQAACRQCQLSQTHTLKRQKRGRAQSVRHTNPNEVWRNYQIWYKQEVLLRVLALRPVCEKTPRSKTDLDSVNNLSRKEYDIRQDIRFKNPTEHKVYWWLGNYGYCPKHTHECTHTNHEYYDYPAKRTIVASKHGIHWDPREALRYLVSRCWQKIL